MDSKVTVIVSLITAFLFLRWFLTPSDTFVKKNKLKVTPEMIELVQQATSCQGISALQIQYDLERTGSVDETVMNIISRNGTLPTPPASYRGTIINNSTPSLKSSGDMGKEHTKNDDEGPFNGLSYEAKKREMVMRARERLFAKEGIVVD